ncbi:MAG: hypothetical protein ACK4NR_04315 [Micavibrio sp.]
MRENALICSQLAIERCRHYIAHIHALIYMTGEKTEGSVLALDNIHNMINLIDQELGDSQDFIRIAQCVDEDEKNACKPSRGKKKVPLYPPLYVVPKS